ncbi:unnamed protein product [Dicrocoelium dendriticum]|nr:unnamed protein product [Dicrocoelium dendriticum]
MRNSLPIVVVFTVLFVSARLSAHSLPWFSRSRTPPSPIHPASLELEPSYHKGHTRHHQYHRQGDFHVLKGSMLRQLPRLIKKRRPVLYKRVLDVTPLLKQEENEIMDDDLLDSAPMVIQSPMVEKKVSFPNIETLDKTPVQVEMIHLLRRLLKPKKRKRSNRKGLIEGAHHIIISQTPAETTTSVQTANNCPQPATGTSGSPRSELPTAPPPTSPLPPSPPPSPPSALSPQSVPPPAPSPPPPGLPGLPRSELPVGSISPSLPATSAGVIVTPSQAALGLQSHIADQTHAALLPLTQRPTVAVTPVLAELGAMLLATQPALGAALGLTTADYGHSAHTVAPVALPQTAAVSLPVPAVVPITQTATPDTHSSLAAELASLVTSLQQQQELQRQHLQQQQQLQQEQQNLLQQQRSQLAQQLQPQQPIQPSAVQPQTVVPQPATPQLDAQGRFTLPTGSQFPGTDGTGVPGSTVGGVPDAAIGSVPGSAVRVITSGTFGQQVPQASTIISMIPRTILSVSSADDDYDVDDNLQYPVHTTRTVKKRKKYFTRKLLRKSNDALLY